MVVLALALAEIHNTWSAYCEAVTENKEAPGWHLNKSPGAELLKFIAVFLRLTFPCWNEVNTSVSPCHTPDTSVGMETDVSQTDIMHSCGALGVKNKKKRSSRFNRKQIKSNWLDFVDVKSYLMNDTA